MKIAGYPAFEVRNLMRKARDLSIRAAFAEEVLGISAAAAEMMIKELAALGYLRTDASADERYWEVTTQGAALALAKAGAPIKRKTADRIVADFLHRVEQVNMSKDYAYRVARVVAFGSYVTDRPDLGDIDIAIELSGKWLSTQWAAGGTYDSWTQPRRDAAVKDGRQLSSMVDYVNWPSTEVLLFLKNRSRAISLTDVNLIPEGAQTKMLYEAISGQSTR
jgi:DNA-binding MarR family transcriptional regulator